MAGNLTEDAMSDFERQTIAIEREKLSNERSKAKWNAASVVIPIIAVLGTIVYGAWSINQQSQLNFEIEAAKAIMQAPSPEEAIGRAKFYAKAFPDRVPANFVKTVDLSGYNEDVNSRIEFLKMVSSRGLNPEQTYRLWLTVFPADQWAKDKPLTDYFENVPSDRMLERRPRDVSQP